MIDIGPLVAAGRTSDVYALGDHSVVKVPHEDVPTHWAAIEARITIAVHGHGVPAPEVRDVLVVDGREAPQ